MNEKACAAALENLREAWAALAMIRETIETLGPSGAVKASEHLDGPTFTHEADALVSGIVTLAASRSGGNAQAELTPEQVYLINDMIHAWIEPEKKGEFRQAFRNDCKRLLATRGVAQVAAHPVQDTWFVDRRLPIMAMSGDIEDDRVLRLMFRHKVTDTDRARLVEVLNAGETALALPSTPSEPAQTAADYSELIEILEEKGRDGDGACECAAKAIKALSPVAQAPTDEQVETACSAYAKATGYYVEFHRGLSSESSDRMRAGMRAALCALSSTTRATPIMRAAENAAKVVDGWSDAKKDYAERVTASSVSSTDHSGAANLALTNRK